MKLPTKILVGRDNKQPLLLHGHPSWVPCFKFDFEDRCIYGPKWLRGLVCFYLWLDHKWHAPMRWFLSKCEVQNEKV